MAKITEQANGAGMCYICAGRFFKGDAIVCSYEAGGNPVAVHAACDPDFAVGESSAQEANHD